MAGEIANRFRILRPLGAGGMGSVFLAEDAWRQGARIAVKCADDADAAACRALEAEFDVLRRLRHPNVVAVLDFGRCESTRQVFLTMEHAGAASLADAAGRPPAEIVRLLAGACRALAFVHSRGIVHRDVKADNVLVVGGNRHGRDTPRLIDFGLAAPVLEKGPGDRFSGTISHAAPEMFAGAPVDGRADLYALGVTAFALLAGRLPFEHDDPVRLAEAHRSEIPPALSGLRPDLPPRLASLVARLLSKEPSQRPAGALDVIESLEQIVPGAPADREDALDSFGAWARAPGLIARDEALALGEGLVARAQDPRAGGSRVLLVEGARGSGKSRLLTDVTARGQLRGVRVLHGRPGAAPWSLFAAPLRDALRHAGIPSRDAAPELALVDSTLGLGAWADSAGLSAADVRLAVGRAFLAALSAAAGDPLILALDDVHLADEESAWLLGYVGRSLASSGRRGRRPRLAMLAAGEIPVGPPVLDGLVEGESLARLPPLSADHVRELVDGMFPGCRDADGLAAMLYGGVGGSAGLAEQWCGSLVATEALAVEAGAWSFDADRPGAREPPADLAAPIVAALARLDEPERALVLALALLTRPIETRDLAAAEGIEASTLSAMIDALERRGVVSAPVRADGRAAGLASDLVRAAARSISSGDDTRRRAARLLDAPAIRAALPAADLAELAVEAGRLGDAADFVTAALDECRERMDHARVAVVAPLAARILEGRPRRDALRDHAAALLALDRIEAAERAAPLATPPAPAEALETARQAALEGRIALRRGLAEEATERLRAAVGADPRDARSTGEFDDWCLDLARAASLADSPDASSILGALEARAGDERLRLRILVARAAHELRGQHTEEAASTLEEALGLARRLGAPIEEAACENNLGVVALRRAQFAPAARHLRRAVDLRMARGARAAAAGTLTNLALLELDRGRPQAALKPARECLSVHEEAGNLKGELLARINVAVAQGMREDATELAVQLAACRRLAERVGDPASRATLALLEAERLVLCGRIDEARAAVRATLASVSLPGRDKHEASALVLAAGVGDAEAAGLVRSRLADASLPKGLEVAGRLASADALLDPDAWATPWEDIHASAEDIAEARSHGLAVLRSAEDTGSCETAAAMLVLALASAAEGRLSDAAREIEAIGPALVRAARPSVRARAWAARGFVLFRRRDLDGAEDAYAHAIEAVRRQARRVPAADRPPFLEAPSRALTREALLRVRERKIELARQGPFFDVVPAGRAGEPASRDEISDLRGATRRLRRTSERLVEVLEISRGINALLPVSELLATTLERAMRFMSADRGFIVLGADENLEFAVSRDRDGRPVPRAQFAISRSVLAEVVRTRQAVLSSDARADARFVRQASVLALDLRSIVVAPLVARSEVVGAMYLDNRHASGAFDESDRDLLVLLATQAAVAVENARLHATRVEKERIDQELSIARTIQQGLLPRALPGSHAFRVAASMEPAREIGGDYYDFIEAPDGRLRIAVGDVSGKGVPAAMFMIMARTILRSFAATDAPLDLVLAEANDVLEAQIEDDKFMTLLLLEPAADGRSIRTCLAGHEPPLVWRRGSGRIETLPEGGLALGMLPGIAGRLEERVVPMGRGDVLTCYSDGVTECRAPGGEMFGRRRLERIMADVGHAGADGTLSGILRALDRFRAGAERSDDVTLVVLEAK